LGASAKPANALLLAMLDHAPSGLMSRALSAFAHRTARWRQHIVAEPSHWPPDLSRSRLTRYANRYLRQSGWDLLPPWEYDDVRVRASRNGLALNIFVVDDSLATIPTVMRDVAETGLKRHEIVGALTQQPIPAIFRHEAEQSGIYLIGPTDLAHIDKAIRGAHRRREQWCKPAPTADQAKRVA